MKAKILILLPTLNEVQYISKLYKRILSLKLNFNYLQLVAKITSMQLILKTMMEKKQKLKQIIF